MTQRQHDVEATIKEIGQAIRDIALGSYAHGRVNVTIAPDAIDFEATPRHRRKLSLDKKPAQV